MTLSYAFVMKCSNGQQNIQFNSVVYFNYVQQFIFLEYFFTKKESEKSKTWHTNVQQFNVFYHFVVNLSARSWWISSFVCDFQVFAHAC